MRVAVTEPLHEFSPDWTVAAAATLRAWMREHLAGYQPDLRLPALVLMCGRGRGDRAEAHALIQEVLDRQPLTEVHFRLLARGTGVPESMWRNLERGYRADLAAGRTDAT